MFERRPTVKVRARNPVRAMEIELANCQLRRDFSDYMESEVSFCFACVFEFKNVFFVCIVD